MRWGLTELIGEGSFFMSNQQAIDAFDGKTGNGVAKDFKEYILQAN